MNRGTASAAEIIAGRAAGPRPGPGGGRHDLRQGHRADPVPAGATDVALRITTARWYTPSGRSIQGAELDSVMGAEHRQRSRRRPTAPTRGRPLAGGGGIVPDVLLRPDTLSTAEQRFARALDGQVSVFRDVLTAYALELRRSSGLPAPRLRGDAGDARRGAAAARRAGASRWPTASSTAGSEILGEQLGYEVARYASGRTAERRRRVSDDPQIRQAVALLRSGIIAAGAAGPGDAGAGQISLIHHAHAGRHLEGEGAVRHRPVHPHLRERQRPRRARRAR